MLKILMATSEANPFAKTGGLADVLGSLPAALNEQDADVRVIMPKYGSIPANLKNKFIHKGYIYINVGYRNQYCGMEQTEYNGITFYFIDNEYYFKRKGFYGYEDEAERFAFFCRAVLETIPHLGYIPDVLHCHDWQTGMIPVLLETQYRDREPYKYISTVFTVHNLRYQGVFDIPLVKELFDLDHQCFTSDKLEFYGGASFLKGGLVYSQLLTTVSKSYALEIQNPYYGEKMDGLLSSRKDSLYGIINGIDYNEYDPNTDPLIVKRYDKNSLDDKNANKAGLQLELNLPVKKNVPMIGLVSRLVDQKGLDLIVYVLDELLKEDIQFVVLGTGDPKYEKMFRETADKYPTKVSANIKFDNTLAHRIYASSDLFLMPSLFEPCGLGQMIAMRYGTLPVVRETGGLKDTVMSYNDVTGKGNGFTFQNINAHDMLYTIKRALELYKYKDTWRQIQKEAMECDYSWKNSARQYLTVYLKAVRRKLEL